MDRYFTFLKDKTAVEYSCQKYYQKFYFNRIIPEDSYTYDNLLEFQEKHPDLFSKKFTFEQLKKSRKKRLVIRKLLTKDLIEQFLNELFNKFNYIKSEDLNYYIYNVGYPMSIRLLLKNTNICFSKNFKEKGKNNITYFMKNLTPEEMINIFVKIIIEYMKNGKYEDFFPLKFSLISKIIFTSSKFYEPNLTTYFRYNKTSEKELMEIITEKLIDESNKGNFDLIKNKDKTELLKEIPNKIINIEEIYNQLNNSKFFFFLIWIKSKIFFKKRKLRIKFNLIMN